MLPPTAANDLQDCPAELFRPWRGDAHDQLRVCTYGIVGDLSAGDILLREGVLRARPQVFGEPTPLRILLGEPHAAPPQCPGEGRPVHCGDPSSNDSEGRPIAG